VRIEVERWEFVWVPFNFSVLLGPSGCLDLRGRWVWRMRVCGSHDRKRRRRDKFSQSSLTSFYKAATANAGCGSIVQSQRAGLRNARKIARS
jgi:hypothetical protein